LYNKKSTEFPHVGVQVNFLMDLSGYYDNLSNSTYTTDNLKLNCATTQHNIYNLGVLLYLDRLSADPANMDLDKETAWVLDQDGSTPDFTGGLSLKDLFDTVEFGNSFKGLSSKDFPDINNNLIGYWNFDELSGATFYDSTSNLYNGLLYNDYQRELAIVGQGVFYNGLNAYGKSDSILIEPTNETVSFWVRGNKNDQVQTLNLSLLHLYNSLGDYLQIQYNLITGNIVVTMTGNTITYNFDLLDNSDHHIAVTFNYSTSQYELFVDGISKQTQTFLLSPSTNNYDLYIAVDQGLNEHFKGFIDELRFYSVSLTDDEIEFLYDSRLGDTSSLANVLYSSSDYITSRYESDDWYIITARLDFSNEIQDIIDDNVTYPTESDKIIALDILYEEIALLTEIGIKDTNGAMKVYGYFPPIEIKKKNHISLQVYIQK
jgi:hypothetical protein